MLLRQTDRRGGHRGREKDKDRRKGKKNYGRATENGWCPPACLSAELTADMDETWYQLQNEFRLMCIYEHSGCDAVYLCKQVPAFRKKGVTFQHTRNFRAEMSASMRRIPYRIFRRSRVVELQAACDVKGWDEALGR